MTKPRMTGKSKKDTVFLILRIMVMLTVMAVIFVFSSQTGEQSGMVSGGLIRSILQFFNIDPHSVKFGTSLHHIIRKTAHFVLYALLGWSICRVTTDRRYFPKLLIVAAVGAAFAVSDEIHQAFVPGRGPGIGDVLIDTCGVIVGCYVTLAVSHLVKRIKARKTKRK